MAIRNIRMEDDPLLRKKSKPVKEMNNRVSELIQDLKDTMVKENGVGIAAPQTGVLKRIFLITKEDGNVKTYINPEIIDKQGVSIDFEGCLSVHSIRSGLVFRPQRIRIKALDEDFNEFEEELEDFIAREFCHENDHLNGILYTDKLLDSNKVSEHIIDYLFLIEEIDEEEKDELKKNLYENEYIYEDLDLDLIVEYLNKIREEKELFKDLPDDEALYVILKDDFKYFDNFDEEDI